MDADERRLGILAGGGKLPREIADSARRRGLPVAIVAIDGEADGDFSGHDVTRVNWGGIGGMIRALKQARVTDLVIVGHVHRPEISGLKPDLGFFRHFPRLLKIVASGGDDSVLRRVVRFFEQQGFRVIAPVDAAPEIAVREGAASAVSASDRDRTDIGMGLDLVRTLGPYDIGQGAVIADGRIEAIEGVEGTDRMISRVVEVRRADGGTRRTGVLVKRSKPGQDLRIDMPAIGPATVDGAREARLSGIAVEADNVLIAERALTLARADADGVFIEGVRDDAAAAPPRFDPRRVVRDFRPLGGIKPRQHSIQDAVKGLAAVEALARFGIGHTAVVVRNHVLAIAADEDAGTTVRRAAGLRQWASLTRRRRGVVVLRDADLLTEALVMDVADAGYAGIAAGDDPAAISGAALAAAERAGLFIMTSPGEGEVG